MRGKTRRSAPTASRRIGIDRGSWKPNQQMSAKLDFLPPYILNKLSIPRSEESPAMSRRSQLANTFWWGTSISAAEHESELISDLAKISTRRDAQRLDFFNDPIRQGEFGISRILAVEPFRDLFNRPI